MAFEPVTLGLGLGNMLFGMGDRERQKTREHRADMLGSEQTRMAPYLDKGGTDAASQQAARYSQAQQSPMGAVASGATSLWAQLQANNAAEEAKKQQLAAQAVNQGMLAQATRRNDLLDKQLAPVAEAAPKLSPGPYSLAMMYPGMR